MSEGLAARALARNCAGSVTPRPGRATSAMTTAAMPVTGTKAAASKGSFGLAAGSTVWVSPVARISAWPSAGAPSRAWLPTTPLPPGRFSMTSGWPSRSPSRWAISRASMSVAPPGGKGTITRTGRLGRQTPWAWAWAWATWIGAGRAASAARPPANCRRVAVLDMRFAPLRRGRTRPALP